MAGFKTHVTTSSLLGVGYAGAGIALGYPIESSLVAGGLCGVAGMLPDIDSDSGVPLRETMGFAAAVVPMLLLDRLQQWGFTYEQLVLAAGGLYLFIRFGVSKLLAKYTVHRGMFHSIPAALTFAGLAFLICGCSNLYLRYFKAGAVLLGVMSHLMLDEIYAIEWARGRWRFKKSFGTAMKLWGKNGWANISAWGKLAIVVLLILGEPMVMERFGEISPSPSGTRAGTITNTTTSHPIAIQIWDSIPPQQSATLPPTLPHHPRIATSTIRPDASGAVYGNRRELGVASSFASALCVRELVPRAS